MDPEIMVLKEFFFEMLDSMLYFNKENSDDLRNQNYYGSSCMIKFYPDFLSRIMDDEML